MKGKIIVMLVGAVLCLCLTGVQAQAKVSYTLKNGTLTISGTGAAKKSFYNNKKIKNLVVKKGVTSLEEAQFSDCKNLKQVSLPSTLKKIGSCCFRETGLKKIVIPKSVRIIGWEALSYCKHLKSVTMPGNFKYVEHNENYKDRINTNAHTTITFNTNLNYRCIQHLCADKLVVKKGDSKFKSIDGVIYTKNGKEIVRVPSGCKSLKVREGCEAFHLSSVFYGVIYDDFGEEGVLKDLKSITLPASVQSVEAEAYPWIELDYLKVSLTVKSKKLSSEDLYLLYHSCHYKNKKIAELYPDKFTWENNMLIGSDHTLYSYIGEDKELIVPEGVERIYDDAICFNEVDFNYEKSRYEVENNLSSVTLPESVTSIGTKAFAGRTKLNVINYPKKLKSVGKSAFRGCPLGREITIDKNMMSWAKDGAFYKSKLTSIVFEKNVPVCKKNTFSSNSVFTFKGGILDSFVQAGASSYIFSAKNKKNEYKTEFTLYYPKVAEASGYQIKFYSDKKAQKCLKTMTTENYSLDGQYIKLVTKKPVKSLKIRAYESVDGKTVYGRWSNIEKI